MIDIDYLNQLLDLKVKLRVKTNFLEEPSEWVEWITVPSPGYLEIPRVGPFKMSDLEWIEVDPIEVKKIGRLVKPKLLDHTASVRNIMESNGIQSNLTGSYFRIENSSIG